GRRQAPRHPGARHADRAPAGRVLQGQRLQAGQAHLVDAARALERLGRATPGRSPRLEPPAPPPPRAGATPAPPPAAHPPAPPPLRGLADAWRRVAADPEIRCAVLTGGGERVFCAGMDMKTTIPAAQRLARGERLDDETFAALRDVATATLVDFELGVPL